jgi:large subunit ribosomal protein L3
MLKPSWNNNIAIRSIGLETGQLPSFSLVIIYPHTKLTLGDKYRQQKLIKLQTSKIFISSFGVGVKYILGHKIGMSQMFDKSGKLTPVTLISVGPCYVLQKKNKEKDGYQALQVGLEKIEKKSKIGKTIKGKEYKFIKEYRTEGEDKMNVGDEINASIFQEGQIVKVSGISKGKGFQGGVKRHGFRGITSTHGQKHQLRTIGSVGVRFPQHVIKGRRMPGRMGSDMVTVKNLKIMKVDKENNLLVIKGAVPGTKRTLLEIKG